MEIHLQGLGKRFGKQWIFRNLDYSFVTGGSYAILGPNGSGKSTLLQTIAGIQEPTEGKITFNTRPLPPPNNLYKLLSLATPYQELIEEYTLKETFSFHTKFRTMRNNLNFEGFCDVLEMEIDPDKYIRDFSSGMKQRVKLSLALCTAASVYFFDEPTTNLDAQGIQWYRNQIGLLHRHTLLIIGSNILHEYDFCNHQLSLK